MKHRILVVDDEQNARDALKTILTEESYDVAEAGSAQGVPGIADASATRTPRTPRTRSSVSTAAWSLVTIAQVPAK